MTKHLVLLGDSIFDNGVYVEPGQANVTAHLERKLPPIGWTLDMRAVDGDVTSSVEGQLSQRPVVTPCTFVLSVGGNDALGHMDMIMDPTPNRTVGEVLAEFHQIREAFRERYTGALNLIMDHDQPLIVCTIYNPQFPETDVQKLAAAGLSFFNDVITEEALRLRLPIIDLREVCSEPEAFSNPIEPSEVGGDLITDAIIRHITT
jgi:hypothetical protein